MFEVIMPKLGLTMETGTIEKWLKKEGDNVDEGDILFEVMTDKVSVEVESYNCGILKKIIRFEGEEVPVTEVVAYIGNTDEKISDLISNGNSFKNTEINISQGKEEIIKSDLAKSNEKNIKVEDLEKSLALNKKLFITPLARKKAKELGIDYKTAEIKGSGPRNRIVKDDIIKHSAIIENNKKAEGLASSRIDNRENYKNKVNSVFKLKGTRKIIAEKMVLSKQTIPHIIISSVANVSELIILKEKIQKKANELFHVKITYTDFILKSAAMALRENINMNSALSDETVTIFDDINIGLAIASEKGLIVPVIFNTDRLSIIAIAKKRIELIGKAKQNTLDIEDITGATFTISNLGMYRVRSFTAIINPPQSSILTIGEIYKNLAMDENNNIKQEYFMDLSVAVDHRIIDGFDGAKFMQNLLNYLENPYFFT